ncbi:MAG: DUF1211 domain-containing protein [Flavobacteriales bacterium]|nr:DUF1211 domain-containing protein [Flavobacteriales bacterium]
MTTNRLEAFSDGVLAIIITIMVLEMKVPKETSLSALLKLWPVFMSYVLSFVYIAIYWNNHHHLLHATRSVNGRILWANLHLLFWLSLVPFTTGWMGENHFTALPTALYGLVLFFAAFAYWLLQSAIVSADGRDGVLARAFGKDLKGKSSIALYAVAVLGAYWQPILAWVLYVMVALIWLVPDRRIERIIRKAE